MDLIECIKRHSENSLRSIEILFDTFDEIEWKQTINGFPIWQQFYHTINSMDRIFSDPENYAWPEFHIENLNNLEYQFVDILEKKVVYSYYLKVKKQIENYLKTISEDMLFKKSNHKQIEMTKFDHIIAQFRHMAFHFGYFHSCAKVMHGRTPDHILI